MTNSSLKMVQSSQSRRNAVVGPPQAATAESDRVSCRRDACSAGFSGIQGSLLLCMLKGGRVWWPSGNAIFLIILCLAPQCAAIFVCVCEPRDSPLKTMWWGKVASSQLLSCQEEDVALPGLSRWSDGFDLPW